MADYSRIDGMINDFLEDFPVHPGAMPSPDEMAALHAIRDEIEMVLAAGD